MGLLGWLTKRKNSTRGKVDDWHRRWRNICQTPSLEAVAELGDALDVLNLPEDEVEVEREMLEGLRHLVARQAAATSGSLPLVETGHRVVGTDRCHFSAPASMPDDANQPSGRLILTHVRAIFAGGGKATTIPWHAVSDVVHQERDVILIRRDRETMYRFRCNLFGDALEAAWLARTLADGVRGTKPSIRHPHE
jgi:hypothetical protein